MTNKRKNSNNNISKKKRVMLNFGQKKEMCLLHQQNPSLTYKELGQIFSSIRREVLDNVVCLQVFRYKLL